jgi:hypothetical protein
VRRVLAVLLVVILACPLLAFGLVTVSLSAGVMDRQFTLGLLDDARLYQLPDAVSGATWSTDVIEGTGGLQWKSVARAARVVLTPDYLRGQARRVVNQVFDSLEGRADWFDLSVDATPIKVALRGDAGRRFARLLAEDLPTGGRLEDFRVSPGRLPVSRPAGMSVDRAAALLQAGIPAFLSSIPDTIRLSDAPAEGFRSMPGGSYHPEGPRFSATAAVMIAGIVVLAFGAGLLVAAAFLGGRTARERVQWCGWPLLVPAAGVLLAGLAAMATSAWIPMGIANARLELYGVAPSFVAAIIDAARHTASRVGVTFLAAGGIATGLSLGLLAWSWAVPPRDDGRADLPAAT